MNISPGPSVPTSTDLVQSYLDEVLRSDILMWLTAHDLVNQITQYELISVALHKGYARWTNSSHDKLYVMSFYEENETFLISCIDKTD